MCCPEEAGEAAEERRTRECRVNEPVEEFSPSSRAYGLVESGGDKRLNAGGVDGILHLRYCGTGETGCTGHGYPTRYDPQSRGHTQYDASGYQVVPRSTS